MLRLDAVRDDWVLPARKASDAVIGYVLMYAERRRDPVRLTGESAIGAVSLGGAAGLAQLGVDAAVGEVEEVRVTEHWKCSGEVWC